METKLLKDRYEFWDRLPLTDAIIPPEKQVRTHISEQVQFVTISENSVKSNSECETLENNNRDEL